MNSKDFAELLEAVTYLINAGSDVPYVIHHWDDPSTELDVSFGFKLTPRPMDRFNLDLYCDDPSGHNVLFGDNITKSECIERFKDYFRCVN